MSRLAHALTYLLASSLVAITAVADDNPDGAKRSSRIAYSAIACQAQLPETSEFLVYNPSGVFVFGPIQNVSMLCPIARTRVNSRRGARVDVVVRRAGPPEIAVRCNLQSLSPDGLEVVDFDEQAADVTNAATAVLELQVEKSEPDGFFVLHCGVPRDYGIVQYIVHER